jgi:hypothetical protein
MQPIVNGIKEQYGSCIKVKRVNFHAESHWHELIEPIGSPEFVLLDENENILYRWIGLTEKEEFVKVLGPLCSK